MKLSIQVSDIFGCRLDAVENEKSLEAMHGFCAECQSLR